MQKAILGLVVMFAAVSCTGVGARTPDATYPRLMVEPTGSPFLRVTSGSVTGLVPHSWHAVPLDGVDFHEGFIASPRSEGWPEIHPSATGIAATWVDATKVGVPSDMYYLAAHGPILSILAASGDCRTEQRDVFANHVPSFVDGDEGSPGDYIARADGTCGTAESPRMRWSYLIAAPGFGPTTTIGIPGSGLYVVVAVTRDNAGAASRLTRLLGHVRFGQAAIGDFVRAARGPLPV